MPTPSSIFKYQLAQRLTITCSGETGECIARSENLISDPQYLLRYKGADGRAVEAWWSQEALADATPLAIEPATAAHTPPAIGQPWPAIGQPWPAIGQPWPAIGQPWPAQGGIYAGIARGADGAPDHHLILCALKPDAELTWSAALDWAAAMVVDCHDDWSLPTRSESALLFANLRSEFSPEWHWTSEANNSSYAWSQDFGYGRQTSIGKGADGRARAVRRLVLQSFGPSA